MPRGSIARRTSDGTTGAAALEIIPNSAGNGCTVREILVCLAAATASTYGLGRPAAKGITPTTPVSFLSEETGDSVSLSSKTAIAWATGPTVPAQFYRRIGFPATIASFIQWTFKDGLYIAPNSSLVLWNLAANGVVDVSIVIDE